MAGKSHSSRLCHSAGQCYVPGLTGNQFLGSNTVPLFFLHFLTSAHDLVGLSFTVALERGIGLIRQRQALSVWETEALAVGRSEGEAG